MGYTHYWSFNSRPKGSAQDVEQAYQLALRQCQRILRAYNAEVKELDSKHPARLSGYSVHTKVYTYGGLQFNGTKELSHEDFCLREHFSQNENNFCKTNRKPYDIVVVACLFTLKHYLGPTFSWSSDGQWHDLEPGRQLAARILRLTLNKVA